MPQNQLLGSNLSYTYGSPVGTSTDFLLFEYNQMAEYAIDDTQVIPSSILLQNVFPSGRSFLYLVQEYDSSGDGKNFLSEEWGIGKIEKSENKSYLKRDYAASYFDGTDYINPEGKPKSSYFPNHFFIIYSHTPTTYYDVLIYPNSVLCNNEYRGPVGVDLPVNTVLGRLSGNVQSLNKTELIELLTQPAIVEIIEQSTDNLTFLCQSLNLAATGARLSAPSIRVLPVYNTTNRPSPQRGNIIYNDQTNRFEGYDGTEWRPFAWASGIGLPYI